MNTPKHRITITMSGFACICGNSYKTRDGAEAHARQHQPLFTPKATVAKLGDCHYCHLPIPAENIDGMPTRGGVEHKVVLGAENIMWHLFHPLYENCYAKEASDPDSEWYEDPRQYAGDDPLADEPAEYYLAPRMYESLPPELAGTSIGRKIIERSRETGEQ